MTKRISPATAIAAVSLFFSMTGVGMAASGYRISSLWQISPHVRRELRGERGRPGPAGVPGAPGVTLAGEYVRQATGLTSATAVCDGSDVAISGGFDIPQGSVISSHPGTAGEGTDTGVSQPVHAWTVTGHSVTGVAAYVVCVPAGS